MLLLNPQKKYFVNGMLNTVLITHLKLYEFLLGNCIFLVKEILLAYVKKKCIMHWPPYMQILMPNVEKFSKFDYLFDTSFHQTLYWIHAETYSLEWKLNHDKKWLHFMTEYSSKKLHVILEISKMTCIIYKFTPISKLKEQRIFKKFSKVFFCMHDVFVFVTLSFAAVIIFLKNYTWTGWKKIETIIRLF